MKKLFSVMLAVVLLFGLAVPTVSAENGKLAELTAEEKQEIFDAWFAFLYEDYIIPLNKYYGSFEEFKADGGQKFALEKLSTENTAIECWYQEDGVYIVTVEHREISYIDLYWLESAGGYVFNFSGVHQALWVYKDGKLYYFKDAYEKGLVSQNALLDLSASYPQMVRAGDMDGNGKLEVSDVIALRSEIAAGHSDASSGVKKSSSNAYGDMDGDGLLTVSDVVRLRTAIMAGD